MTSNPISIPKTLPANLEAQLAEPPNKFWVIKATQNRHLIVAGNEDDYLAASTNKELAEWIGKSFLSQEYAGVQSINLDEARTLIKNKPAKVKALLLIQDENALEVFYLR